MAAVEQTRNDLAILMASQAVAALTRDHPNTYRITGGDGHYRVYLPTRDRAVEVEAGGFLNGVGFITMETDGAEVLFLTSSRARPKRLTDMIVGLLANP